MKKLQSVACLFLQALSRANSLRHEDAFSRELIRQTNELPLGLVDIAILTKIQTLREATEVVHFESLDKHIAKAWRNYYSNLSQEFQWVPDALEYDYAIERGVSFELKSVRYVMTIVLIFVLSFASNYALLVRLQTAFDQRSEATRLYMNSKFFKNDQFCYHF